VTEAPADHAVLNPVEARVLGCLIEKSITTPDGYPLSLNALRLACNQTTNRDPVVHYDDLVVESALATLRERGLARRVKNPGERVVKHRHVVADALSLDPPEIAIMCVLLVRAAQTPGELKQRTDRMHEFATLDAVESSLALLAERGLVARLDRRPGQKESRWRELLSERDHTAEPAAVATSAVGERTVPSGVTSLDVTGTSLDSDANEAIDADPARLDVVDARTGTLIRSLATDSVHEVNAKVARARAVLPAWSARGHAERSGLVLEALARIDDDRDELATIAACETGSDEGAIARALAAAVADALAGTDERPGAGGVVAIITGGADPHATLVTTGVGAVLAGSTIVVKPSPAATLSALAIVERLHECGVPADVVQCVVGGAGTGAAVVRAGVDRVCFAGEHETGAKVARLAGERSTPTDLVLRSRARTRGSDALR